MNEVAVIGGGASGLAAAISAAENGCRVTIYEAMDRIGKKILATGNGRCNISNSRAGIGNYYGKNPKFILGAKNRYWVNETIEFFERIGVLIKEENDGKLYPYSNQASSVLDALRFYAEDLGIKIITGFEAKSISKSKDGFSVLSLSGGRAFADRVILSCGGKAAPSLGGKGGGYDIAKSLGHTVMPLSPSLVQLKTKERISMLKGIKADALLTCGRSSYSGELLFTDYGISGPPVFSMSAKVTGSERIKIDFMPEYPLDEVRGIISYIKESFGVRSLDVLLSGILNRRLSMFLLKAAGCAPLSRTASQLSDTQINAIASCIKSLELSLDGKLGWNNAQVTKGGVDTDGINPSTMESKRVRGLYIVGELLDIDGDCGGYNLQWAWSSGHIAGESAARSFEAHR